MAIRVLELHTKFAYTSHLRRSGAQGGVSQKPQSRVRDLFVCSERPQW